MHFIIYFDFDFLSFRVAIGPHEEYSRTNTGRDTPPVPSNRPRKSKGPLFECLESFLAPYYRLMERLKRHPTCPHPSSCVAYSMKVSTLTLAATTICLFHLGLWFLMVQFFLHPRGG